MIKTSSSRQNRMMKRWFWMMLAFLVVGLMGAEGIPAGVSGGAAHGVWEPFSFWTSSQYSGFEKVALLANVVIALAGLGYALMLVGEVYSVWPRRPGTVSAELCRSATAPAPSPAC